MLSEDIAEFVLARANFWVRASFFSVAASNGPKHVQLDWDQGKYRAKEMMFEKESSGGPHCNIHWSIN